MDRPRVLIVRFSAIGDCVMTAWAATAIRQKYPQAFLAWAAESRCVPVIDTDHLVNQVIDVPRDRWKKEHRLLEPLRLFASLRKHQFDIGIDFQGHSKTAICLRLAQPKRRIGAKATDAFARLLNPVPKLTPESEHEVDLNLALIRTWEEFEAPTQPTMPWLIEEREHIRGLVRSSGRLVTIQTGAGAADKIVPSEHWGKVATSLLSEGYRVVTLGGANDPRVEVDGVLNLVGGLTLRQAMAAVAESDLHLAGDTGTGHIAAAYGTPVVSVFGPTPPERYRPWSSRAVVLRDASKCVESVSPDLILAEALSVLEEAQA